VTGAPRLAGKVALVTGGASGIGRATALRFAAHGAQVVIGDLAVAENASERDAEQDALTSLVLDVTNEASWARVVEEVERRFGKLDVVVNGAGIVVVGDVETMELEAFRRVLAVNVEGVFLGCRYAVRAMKESGGSIVNISSVSGIIGTPNLVAYDASKGAVRLLTKSVALYCAKRRYGIRCNSVHPTFVDTPMFKRVVAGTRDPEWTKNALAAAVPIGRVAQPEEIADLIVYLASDESKFVTGSELVIDGGLTAQ
jgi:NAD(P)-dependent dehydrogenase (short-subunit alcohol dehydrogenase family)